jgi:hypothetical protein
MCSLPVFVGLDYHDSSVRECVLDSDGRELANADNGGPPSCDCGRCSGNNGAVLPKG